MPNWCNNHIRITHEDPAEIDRIEAAAETGILQALLPCPEELLDERTGSYGGEDADEKDALRESLRAKYGHTGWYDWQVANWGTKWDLCEPTVNRIDANNIEIDCDTAWAPPTAAYHQMLEMGYGVTGYYYEPGMAFVGRWDDGIDETYEIGGETSATVRDVIGDELDDMFCISENMAEWEAENEEDEDLTVWIKDGIESRKEAAE